MGIRLSINEINKRVPSSSYLTAVSYEGTHTSKSGTKRSIVKCVCKCGKEVNATVGDLTRGNPQSCGCIKKGRKPVYKFGDASLYRRWCDMRRRCYDPTKKIYQQYGAKGVRVCDEWLNSYETFAIWALSNGYSPDLQLDKDTLGDGKLYSPSTCKWVTQMENMAKISTTLKIEWKGQILNLAEIARMEKIKYAVLASRYKLTKDIKKAVNFEDKAKKFTHYSN